MSNVGRVRGERSCAIRLRTECLRIMGEAYLPAITRD